MPDALKHDITPESLRVLRALQARATVQSDDTEQELAGAVRALADSGRGRGWPPERVMAIVNAQMTRAEIASNNATRMLLFEWILGQYFPA
jgi:hypothetical protein